MFATAITAWRLSQVDTHPRSRPPAVRLVHHARSTRTLLGPLRVDRVDQRSRGGQPIDRQPIR